MLILAIPVITVFIPEEISERFLSIFNLADSSIASRLSIWRSSIRMLSENIFTGIGMGTDAFSREFLKFAEDSVTAPHSHNLFLQIGCEAGIFALALFLHLLFLRMRHRASYARYVKYASVGSICTMAGTALFSLIIFGMTDYIFYSSSMTMLFFTVFGIGSATLRISKNEYEDAKVGGFGESSDTSAEILISIRE
jgi:putative inorganic carbon (HCO3(-)) transporter